MPRLSIWNSGRKSSDYKYIDRNIAEFFGIGGTGVYAHLYIGPYLQTSASVDTMGDAIGPFNANNPSVTTGSITTIEDPVLMENRDRKYSPNVIELRGIYNLNDLDFDLRQFGLFLSNDTVYIEFHLNDMIARCGRKLMPGDVLELPHRRDTGLDPARQVATNKFYVIEDAARASDGYSATWWPHIWRVKVSPMPAGQEFADIINAPLKDPLGLPIHGIGSSPVTLGDIATTGVADLAINEANDVQAKLDVSKRYFETRQYWMAFGDTGDDYPWVFAGDGQPPNGATLLGSGNKFPSAPNTGEYYLRTDYKPETLFMWNGHNWTIQEQNYRPNWTAASSFMLDFINNNNIRTNTDGSTAPEKTNLSKAVLPKADF